MPSAEIASLLTRPEWSLLVALAIGLLVGLERERQKGKGPSRAPAGLRTFAIVGLLGGVTAISGHEGLVVMAAAFVALGALAAYALGPREDPGLTGEVALVLTFALGVLAQARPALAVEVAVVVTALLAFRVPLHRFVRDRISDQELRDALTFALAALVVLPLIPNRSVDPFGLLNPFVLWRLAVIAMALSFLGHMAQRLVGARYGLLVAGLAAGLVSSTAAVAAMGGRSRAQPALASASAAGGVASMIGSLAYLGAILGAVSPDLVLTLAIPLALSAVLMLGYAGWLVRGTTSKATPKADDDGRAFNGVAILLFVALVGGFSVVSELLVRGLGAGGALAGAAVMGLADAHAAGASMAALLASGKLGMAAATIGVILTLTTNMAVKIPTAFLTGSRAYALKVTVGAGLLLAGLWIGCAVLLLTGVFART